MAALQRVGEIQALVEVGHQFHVVADRIPNRSDCGEIVARPIAAEPQLQAQETAFVAQHDGVSGKNFRGL